VDLSHFEDENDDPDRCSVAMSPHTTHHSGLSLPIVSSSPLSEKSPVPLLDAPKSASALFLSPLKPTSESSRFPSLFRKEGRQSSILSSVRSTDLSSPSTPVVPVSPIKRGKRRVINAPSNNKEFKGLVALINHASKSGSDLPVGSSSPGTAAVLRRWEELSKI
jgi:hypothetical protein